MLGDYGFFLLLFLRMVQWRFRDFEQIFRFFVVDDEDNNTYHHWTEEQGTTNNKPLIIKGSIAAPIVGNSYWIQLGSDIDGEGTNEYFGTSIAMSSNGLKIAIGAKGANSDNGLVRVYELL